MEENITQPEKTQTEVIQTPQIPPTNSKEKSRTPLILVVFLIAILFSFALGFFLGKSLNQTKAPLPSPVTQVSPTATLIPTATPDPTANWKTYSNKLGKYEIKYPSEAIIEEKGELQAPYCVVIKVGLAQLKIKLPKGTYGGCITTGLDSDPSAQVIDENINLLGKETTASGMNLMGKRLSTERNSAVGAKSTDRFEFLRISDVGGFKDFVIEYGGYYDEENTKTKYQNDKKTIYLILSTFKFTE